VPGNNLKKKASAGHRHPTTHLWLKCAALILSLVAVAPPAAIAQTPIDLQIPKFRSSDSEAPAPQPATAVPLRLLAETDFAPWSFALEDGALAGISIDLVRLACIEAGLTCEITASPFTALLPTLRRGEGDAIVSGLRLSPALVAEAAVTRPYFRALGRFMIREGTQIESADPRALAGRRVGVVRATTHEVFLARHYGKAQIVTYQRETEMYEALRTGTLDVAFGDSMRMSFWMNSDGARKCCTALGGAMIDPETFSRPLVYVLRKDKAAARDRLDAALDRLEEKGETARIFARYLPAAIW
jgi:polar amino acid transport system substrate-binding protein